MQFSNNVKTFNQGKGDQRHSAVICFRKESFAVKAQKRWSKFMVMSLKVRLTSGHVSESQLIICLRCSAAESMCCVCSVPTDAVTAEGRGLWGGPGRCGWRGGGESREKDVG